MYLVQIAEENKIVECDTFEEVEKLLLRACALWMYSGDYSDEELNTPQKLFDYCMAEKDFGDIAQVLEIDAYFTIFYDVENNITDKVACDIIGCDLRVPFKCQRIL